jgi:uncharacterized membrane protein
MDEAPKPGQTVIAPPASGDDVEKGKATAWLSYLWLLWLVPLLAMKENAFCKFHAKQGIVLSIYSVAVWIVGKVPFIGGWIVRPVGGIILLVLAIMGIVNSLNGKYWKCPLGVAVLAEKWFKF